jgi:hypothetical protein
LEVFQLPINTKENYIEIGTAVFSGGVLDDLLVLPAPTELPSSNEFLADAGRNAIGQMVISQIGRTQYKSEISWSSLDSEKWWEINRWFEKHGYVFYMKYFSHTMGRIVVQRFYRGNVKAGTPSTNQKNVDGFLVPQKYHGVGFSVIDMGEDNVTILQSF